MLQVASVLSRYCICFIHIFQMYVTTVSYASDVDCIQMFMFQKESRGHGPSIGDEARQEPADGACSSSSRLLDPARARREKGSEGKRHKRGVTVGARDGEDANVRTRGDREEGSGEGVTGVAFFTFFFLRTYRI
jgi:hypothetical protein